MGAMTISGKADRTPPAFIIRSAEGRRASARNETEARRPVVVGSPNDKRPGQIVVEERAETTGPRAVPPDTFTLPAMTSCLSCSAVALPGFWTS